MTAGLLILAGAVLVHAATGQGTATRGLLAGILLAGALLMIVGLATALAVSL